MTEFYYCTNSFAAPFFSDSDDGFVEADSPVEAMTRVVAEYKHPAGLYSAGLWASADAEKKGERKLAAWVCNHEIAKRRAFAETGGCSYLGNGPGRFEVDGKNFVVADPKGGELVEGDGL